MLISMWQMEMQRHKRWYFLQWFETDHLPNVLILKVDNIYSISNVTTLDIDNIDNINTASLMYTDYIFS